MFIALFYKQLLFMTFDPDVAPIFGMRSGRIDALFALALAATIVASINIVGVTLIAATLIIPATTARLLTDSFGRMLVLSAFLGASAGALGMYLSYWQDVSSGATIVLLEAAMFVVAFAGARSAGTGRRGRPARWRSSTAGPRYSMTCSTRRRAEWQGERASLSGTIGA